MTNIAEIQGERYPFSPFHQLPVLRCKELFLMKGSLIVLHVAEFTRDYQGTNISIECI